MSRARDLEQMQTICEAHYAKAQQEFAKLRAEEDRLRAELDRLVKMGAQAKAPTTEVAQMQAIGADLIWQGWLGRTKETLNMSLAQVLAAKEYHINDVRKAYGKLLVVKKLLGDLKAEKRKKATQVALSTAIELSVMTASRNQ